MASAAASKRPSPPAPIDLDASILAMISIVSKASVLPAHLKDDKYHMQPETLVGIRNCYLQWSEESAIADEDLYATMKAALKIAAMHGLLLVKNKKQVWDPAVLKCKSGVQVEELIKSRQQAARCSGEEGSGNVKAAVQPASTVLSEPRILGKRPPPRKQLLTPTTSSPESLTASYSDDSPLARRAKQVVDRQPVSKQAEVKQPPKTLDTPGPHYLKPTSATTLRSSANSTPPVCHRPRGSAAGIKTPADSPAKIGHKPTAAPQTTAETGATCGQDFRALQQMIDKHENLMLRFAAGKLSQPQIDAMDELSREIKRRSKQAQEEREREKKAQEDKVTDQAT